MIEPGSKTARGSSAKALIGLSVFLLLIGGMVMDPLAGLFCFVLAGIPASIAVFSGARWSKYIAVFLLIITILLAISIFPEARDHLRAYRSKALTGDRK